LAVVSLALTALTATIVWAVRVFSRSSDRSDSAEPPQAPLRHPVDLTDRVVHLEGVFEGFDLRFEALTVAVSEGIAGYQRAEKRVQKTVASARRLVAEHGLEHAGIEAEAAELLDRDAGEGDGAELQLMPEAVEDLRPSGIPGVSRKEIADIIERSAAR
jgi:hypothetical protein